MVAETLDVSPRTVLRWIDAGELGALRLPGGQLRIPQTALAAFVEGHATTPARRMVEAGVPGDRGAT
jgi:excisionase family DNA binding protein